MKCSHDIDLRNASGEMLLVSLEEYALENVNLVILFPRGLESTKNLEEENFFFKLSHFSIFCSLLFQFVSFTLTQGTNFLLITGKMIMC